MRSSSWIAPDPLPSLSPLRRCLHPAPARDHDTARSRQSDTAARRAPHPYLRCALPYAHTPSHPDPVAPNAVRPGPDGAPLPPPASSDGCGCVWAWRRYRGGAAGIRTPARRLAPVCGRAWTRTRDLGLIRTALSPPELRAPPRRGQTPRGGVCAEDGVNPQGPHSGSVRSPAGTKMARPQLGVAARWSTVHHPAPRQDQSGSLDLSPGHP
jgi:hypothetical protein